MKRNLYFLLDELAQEEGKQLLVIRSFVHVFSEAL